ncbi:hypothetical protein E2562_014128 [Oryza meyeriana var. granulata]|uniref:Uncharacterized protein n=1 Tax=Oryza meyeriana var. granulata TaxID=110450 RepID=A0A6G1F880_9ORYZ|nr:hypothetical protein E2562_014128 [Oryza meyeriana var. granulata]
MTLEGLQPNAKISPLRLIWEIRERKDDPNAVRFFIMVMRNKLFLPTTNFYIMQKDAYLGNDLARVARIDWSKVVFDSIRAVAFVWHENDQMSKHQTYITACTPFLVLLYVDNMHHPQDNGVDPMHIP